MFVANCATRSLPHLMISLFHFSIFASFFLTNGCMAAHPAPARLRVVRVTESTIEVRWDPVPLAEKYLLDATFNSPSLSQSIEVCFLVQIPVRLYTSEVPRG